MVDDPLRTQLQIEAERKERQQQVLDDQKTVNAGLAKLGKLRVTNSAALAAKRAEIWMKK